jgi:hypothetical protein
VSGRIDLLLLAVIVTKSLPNLARLA